MPSSFKRALRDDMHEKFSLRSFFKVFHVSTLRKTILLLSITAVTLQEDARITPPSPFDHLASALIYLIASTSNLFSSLKMRPPSCHGVSL